MTDTPIELELTPLVVASPVIVPGMSMEQFNAACVRAGMPERRMSLEGTPGRPWSRWVPPPAAAMHDELPKWDGGDGDW